MFVAAVGLLWMVSVEPPVVDSIDDLSTILEERKKTARQKESQQRHSPPPPCCEPTSNGPKTRTHAVPSSSKAETNHSTFSQQLQRPGTQCGFLVQNHHFEKK
jgi:hypothetical protein